jgi:starvation-inducible DNA-binding protein
LFTDLIEKIDEIAERILTLCKLHEYRYSTYFGKAEIKEAMESKEVKKDVKNILTGFGTLIKKHLALLKASAETNNKGISRLMSGNIRDPERRVWMNLVFLNN